MSSAHHATRLGVPARAPLARRPGNELLVRILFGSALALIAIGVMGGLSHLFLTESYRYAPASVVAPFDYAALLWAFFFGYMLFGEVPTFHVYLGAAVVAASGLFVIWRERRRARTRGKKMV